MKKKTATLLIVKPGNTLSSQLKKITGDTYNSIDFEIFEKGDFIRHKKTGRQFVVMSENAYKSLKESFRKKVFHYYKNVFNLKYIKTK